MKNVERVQHQEVCKSPEDIFSELTVKMKTFERELNTKCRQELFDRFVAPLLFEAQKIPDANERHVLARRIFERIKDSSVQDALKECIEDCGGLDEFIELPSPVDVLKQKVWTTFAEEQFVSKASSTLRESKGDVGEIDPEHEVRVRKEPLNKEKDRKQPRDKGEPRRRPAFARRQQKLHRVAIELGGREEKEVALNVPLRKISESFHDVLHTDEGFAKLSVEDIFGDNIVLDELVSKNVFVIETRLRNLQRMRSTRDLIQRVLETVEDFLRSHESEMNQELPSMQEKREHFPSDDRVDGLLRAYLAGLLDWYPHVYNSSLDIPYDRQSFEFLARRLRMYMNDGLFKTLGIIEKEFTYEGGVGRELDHAVRKIVEDWYFGTRTHSGNSAAAK